jgi:SAM-dependent methyltransferase
MNSVISVSSVAETSRAFDAVAPEYDGALGNNMLIQRMRERVIGKIVATFPRGARLLDLGCGTGIDAVDLAARGYEIVAIDSSGGMVERTWARILDARLEDRAHAMQLGIHELEGLRGAFDGVYSNLGPLNCVSDLRAAAHGMARLLKPRGKIIASVIGKYCPWELAFYALRFDIQRARIRLTNDRVPVPLQSETVWTRYYSPREFYRAFANEFELIELQALNVFMPPPYLAHACERHKNFFAPLEFLDDQLSGAPLVRNFGDHFLIELQKRN